MSGDRVCERCGTTLGPHAWARMEVEAPEVHTVERCRALAQAACACKPGWEDPEFRDGHTDLCVDAYECAVCAVQPGDEPCYADQVAASERRHATNDPAPG